MPKRKSQSSVASQPFEEQVLAAATDIRIVPEDGPPPAKRRASGVKPLVVKEQQSSMNPDINEQVLDAPGAIRASPDAGGPDERMDLEKAGMDAKHQLKTEDDSEFSLSDAPDEETPSRLKAKKAAPKARAAKAPVTPEKTKPKTSDPQDPEADEDVEVDEEELKEAVRRPPPVNSDYLPLPWKGRLGYVNLCTISCAFNQY